MKKNQMTINRCPRCSFVSPEARCPRCGYKRGQGYSFMSRHLIFLSFLIATLLSACAATDNPMIPSVTECDTENPDEGCQ